MSRAGPFRLCWPRLSARWGSRALPASTSSESSAAVEEEEAVVAAAVEEVVVDEVEGEGGAEAVEEGEAAATLVLVQLDVEGVTREQGPFD